MNNDNAIKDKLNSLDTLDGGIVFGKEDAWRKLHSRLDAAPARNKKPLYWLAAAAALALLLLVAKLYNQPAPQMTSATPVAAPMPLMPVPAQPAVVAESTQPVAKTKIINKQNSRYSERRIAPPLIVPTPTEQIVDIAVVPTPTLAPAPTAPPKPRPMRIVHLSELDKDITPTTAENEPEQPNTALAEIMKLPPVHINDLLHEETYLQELRRENRLTVGGISILLNAPQRTYNGDNRYMGGLKLRIY